MSTSITIMNRLFWPRRYGGLEQVLWQLSNAFADQGVGVQVLTEQVDDLSAREDAREGLGVFRVLPVEFGRLWRVGEMVQVRWWMRALRGLPRTDYLWANEPTAAMAAVLIGRAKDLIYRPVFCYAGMHHVSQCHVEMAMYARTPLSRWMDRLAYRRAGLVIDESANLRQQQRRWYGPRHNTLIIPNATSHATIRPPHTTGDLRRQIGLSPNDFVIGFVGRPGDPCKDLPFLLNALTHQPLPDHAKLLIVGGGRELEQARSWVRQAGLDHRTVWTGNLEDTGPAYRAMDVLVLPSRFETFGNVIIEAAAHGRPAIGRSFSDHPTLPIYTASEELIDHETTGYVVNPHDPGDLADRLGQLAHNPALAKRFGAAARHKQQTYQWSDVVQRYLSALGVEYDRVHRRVKRAA